MFVHVCVAGFCICVCVGECVQACPSYFQIGNLFGSCSQTCNFVMYGSLFVDKSTICKSKCRGMRVSLKNDSMIHMFDHVCHLSVKNLLGPEAATTTQTNHRQNPPKPQISNCKQTGRWFQLWDALSSLTILSRPCIYHPMHRL